MRLIREPSAMQQLALRWLRQGVHVAFVPTMGYLHDGHLSLIRLARKHAGPKGRVVVSIYLNPTQFGPHEDLSRYPRDLPRDLRLCRKAGVHVVFAPNDPSMYPGLATGQYSTFVVEEHLSRLMEGASRPGHFRGVTTIVAKLFHLVLPRVAIFGAKDWQQAVIIRRMTTDLNFPVQIVVAPTVREPDGLAMSSRNTYLNPEERRQATVLYQAIQTARQLVCQGPQPAPSLKQTIAQFIATRPLAKLDYVEFFDSDTLQPVSEVTPGTHMALAVFIGHTRLIDNAKL